ncbi:MBL fold metallo-hydrolase [Chimaeribacter arupi]|uniref:MBL fold metallo-hydrolase n=1 Tax=Chimaeribacter arupi TaxID=2060066 RepID=UPI000C7D90A1|nr:MBL fold metallo-hydrolase [Chimaeribacter arupi]PLR30141.1 MBL fold metallo-hydrolase [Chimaeribacter arupi]
MQSALFPSCQVGSYEVIALSDGTMEATLDLLSGIQVAEAESIQRSAGIANYGHIHINCYLIRGSGRTILIDAGAGGHNNVGGQLREKQEMLGIHPDEIDTILLTHGHPDHIGGLLDERGGPVYKKAELYLHPLEVEHWLDDEKQQSANERGKRNFILARKVLNAYAGKIRLADEREITPGIRPVWLPGHTPGHMGFRIDSGDQSLMIWGDLVHFPHVQSACPSVGIAFDVDLVQARETRQKFLEQAVREKLLIAGMHLNHAGFARLLRAENGYRVVYP